MSPRSFLHIRHVSLVRLVVGSDRLAVGSEEAPLGYVQIPLGSKQFHDLFVALIFHVRVRVDG